MKKLLAVILAMLMLLSLVACGGEAGNDDATPTPATEPTGTEEVDYTEGGKYMNDPGANGNSAWKLLNYPVTSDTVTYLCHYEVKQPDADDESAFRDIYNMKWATNVVGANDRITKLISSVMGGESPDIFRYDTFLPTLVNKGYIVDWDSYIDLTTGLWADLQGSLDAVLYKNAHYGLSSNSTIEHGDGVWVNLEVFEELGVKSPLEYYAEGNWTWDTFRQCALETQTDSDGDGIPEVWGTSLELEYVFIYAAGKEIVSLNADGTFSNNILSPEIARAVEFYTQIYNDGICYDGSDGRTVFTQGKIATMVGCYWYYKDAAYGDMFSRNAIGWVPYPRDPQADKYYVQTAFGEDMLCANAPNPYGAAALMDSLRYDALDDADNEEVDPTEYFEENGIPYEFAMNVLKERNREGLTPVLMTWQTFEMGQFWGDIWFRPLLGEPWSVIAEEISPKIDSVLETIAEG